MNKNDIMEIAAGYVEGSAENRIAADVARQPDLAGMKIFEAPLFGAAAADDEIFEAFKSEAAIGRHFMKPKEWLAEAKTVLSFFLPFEEKICAANESEGLPADEWLHGRIDGQKFIIGLCKHMVGSLEKNGIKALVPVLDPRFKSYEGFKDGKPAHAPEGEKGYTSNWSERHAAYACGLGTFGLSKGIITEKGTAGRLCSIIIDKKLEPSPRTYSGLYDYCINCGACIRRCPAGAITKEGKAHKACSEFLLQTQVRFFPYYGCGKCQVGVPCARCRPM